MFAISLPILVCILASQATAFQPFNRVSSKSIRSSSSLPAASSDVIELQDSNFRGYFSSETPILIDACAEFCGPCKLIEPIINQCALERKDNLVVSRYDVESDSNEIKLELLLQRVMPKALPSLILIQNNKILGTKTGLISADALNEFLDSSLAKSSSAKPGGMEQDNENKARRIKRKGLISFTYMADDYMLKGDQF
jgi:thioredoxin-like negative regulator of GroEL